MAKRSDGAEKKLKPWHGLGAALLIVGIAVGGEACQGGDVLVPESGPIFLEVDEATGGFDSQDLYGGPEYALPHGPKDFNDLLAQAAAKVPGGFGGAYKETDGSIVVWLKDLRKTGVALDSLMAMQPTEVKSYHRVEAMTVRFVEAAYDWRDLNRWFKLAARQWRTGVVFMDIDDRTNRVYVGVSSAGLAAGLRADIEAAGVPSGALVIGVESPIVPAIGPLAGVGAKTDGTNVTLGQTVDPPYFAGFKAEGASTNGPCTMGPIVRLTSTRNGYLTASHCTQRIYSDDGRDHFQATTNDNNIGQEYDDAPSTRHPHCDVTALCRRSDAALIEFDDATDAARGHIARIASLGSTALTAAADDEWLVADADPACPFGLVETACFPAVVGTELQYVGYVSGWQKGTLDHTCALSGYVIGVTAYQIRCSDIVTGTSAPGNSGAPVFELTSHPREVNLWGILHGQTEDGTQWTVSRIEGIRLDLDRSFNVLADLRVY